MVIQAFGLVDFLFYWIKYFKLYGEEYGANTNGIAYAFDRNVER